MNATITLPEAAAPPVVQPDAMPLTAEQAARIAAADQAAAADAETVVNAERRAAEYSAAGLADAGRAVHLAIRRAMKTRANGVSQEAAARKMLGTINGRLQAAGMKPLNKSDCRKRIIRWYLLQCSPAGSLPLASRILDTMQRLFSEADDCFRCRWLASPRIVRGILEGLLSDASGSSHTDKLKYATKAVSGIVGEASTGRKAKPEASQEPAKPAEAAAAEPVKAASLDHASLVALLASQEPAALASLLAELPKPLAEAAITLWLEAAK